MKKLLNIFSIILVAVALLAATTRSAEATFNICTVFPWLPQCQPDPTPSPSPSPTPDPTPVPCEQTEQGCPVEEATPSANFVINEGCSEDCGGESHPNECTINPPKPPVNLSYEKIDGGVKIKWVPTTDSSDFQIVKYGKTQDNLEYGIPSLPKDATEVDIFGMPSPFWVAVGASHNFCVSWTKVIDP